MKYRFLILIAALMAFGSISTAAAVADSTTTVTPVAFSQSSFNLSSEDSSVDQSNLGATLAGRLEIKAQEPQLQHQLLHEHGLKCQWGDAIWGASTTSTGQTVWIAKPGNHGWTHACWIHGQWRQILGPGQWNCGNVVVFIHHRLPRKAIVFTGKFVIVRHFIFTAHATVSVIAAIFGQATATCKTDFATASATEAAWGTATASASASASARSSAKAVAQAQASSLSVVTSEKVSLSTHAQASASAKISGEATAFCSSPTPQSLPSIIITSMTTLNQIPAGDNSGPFDIEVNASAAGGSLTVDPGIGAVSSCNSTVPEGSITFSDLPAGDITECVILYAPNDSDKPPSMTITATAVLGSASDQQSETFTITYPIRPS